MLTEHQVKDLHNFLVGNGVVVHNGCFLKQIYASLVETVLLKGSNIAQKLIIKTKKGKKVYIGESGLKHLHERIFKKGANIYQHKFEYKIGKEAAERDFAKSLDNLLLNVESSIDYVVKNEKWEVPIKSGRWELIYKAPSPGREIHLFHAVKKF